MLLRRVVGPQDNILQSQLLVTRGWLRDKGTMASGWELAVSAHGRLPSSQIHLPSVAEKPPVATLLLPCIGSSPDPSLGGVTREGRPRSCMLTASILVRGQVRGTLKPVFPLLLGLSDKESPCLPPTQVLLPSVELSPCP